MGDLGALTPKPMPYPNAPQNPQIPVENPIFPTNQPMQAMNAYLRSF
jgi:hypothetical protein